jgi:hypothetical protein
MTEIRDRWLRLLKLVIRYWGLHISYFIDWQL